MYDLRKQKELDTNNSINALVVLSEDFDYESMEQVIEFLRSSSMPAVIYLKYVIDMDPVDGIYFKDGQFEKMREKAQQATRLQEERLKATGLEVKVLRPHFGIAAEEILRVEKQLGPDVIVIVAPSRSIFKRFLMGRDFSEDVVRKARTPVLTVRPTSVHFSTGQARYPQLESGL